MADIRPVEAGLTTASGSQNQDIRQIAKQLKMHIDTFNQMLPPQPDQLKKFAGAIQNLNTSSLQALDMTKKPVNRLMEEVQDSAETTQTILSQPLSNEGTNENASLISAATSYKEEDGKESDLYKISLAFWQYPDQTEMLRKELTLTSEDLAT